MTSQSIWTVYRFLYPSHYNELKPSIHLWEPSYQWLIYSAQNKRFSEDLAKLSKIWRSGGFS